MRTTLFLILLVATFSKTGKFLSASNDGSPLTFTIIEENTCQITRYQAKPDSIIPGDSLEFKMQFSALQEIYIKELFLDTLNNGVSLYTDSFAIDKTYATGEKMSSDLQLEFRLFVQLAHGIFISILKMVTEIMLLYY